jgi:hypothetical protein
MTVMVVVVVMVMLVVTVMVMVMIYQSIDFRHLMLYISRINPSGLFRFRDNF